MKSRINIFRIVSVIIPCFRTSINDYQIFTLDLTAFASSTFQNATESFRSFFRTAEGVYVPFVITPNLALKSIFLGLWNPASVFAVSIRVEEKENLLMVAKPARGFPLSKSRSIRVLRVFAFMTELVSNFFFGGLVITDLGETKMRLLNSGRIEIPI